MRRREFYWSLYHRSEKNLLTDLRTDQLEAIWAALPEALRSQYLIWKDGLKNWKPFTEFPILIEDLRHSTQTNTISPPQPPPDESKIDEIETAIIRQLESELAQPPAPDRARLSMNEHRQADRVHSNLRVRVAIAGKEFTTRTVNISMLGMQLRDRLPSWVPKYFAIELHYESAVIPLFCSRIKSEDGSADTRIKIESNDNCEILRRWLTSAPS